MPRLRAGPLAPPLPFERSAVAAAAFVSKLVECYGAGEDSTATTASTHGKEKTDVAHWFTLQGWPLRVAIYIAPERRPRRPATPAEASINAS